VINRPTTPGKKLKLNKSPALNVPRAGFVFSDVRSDDGGDDIDDDGDGDDPVPAQFSPIPARMLETQMC
jgi:hypothetical protein